MMPRTQPRSVTSGSPATGERGAVVVEFSLVAVLLVFLILGIIAFGMILSFKQQMTQAAEEGAREAVGAIDDPGTTTVDEREQQAFDVARAAIAVSDDRCCSVDSTSSSTAVGNNPSAPMTLTPEIGDYCAKGRAEEFIKVTIAYPYDDEPLVPVPTEIPPLSFLFPDTLTSEATVDLPNRGFACP